jgi:radical SAM protein with 4Fe4S-binding SPASM domain
MAMFVLGLSDRCNFKCSFCRPKEQRSNTDLVFDRVVEALEIAKEHHICGNWFTSVQLNGNGESLLYDKLGNVVVEAKKRFSEVEVITNGYLLDKKGDELLEAGIDRIQISLTGITAEIYSKFQGSGISEEQCKKNLEKVIDNVIELVKKRDRAKKTTKIILRYIKSNDSKRHLREYIAFWKKHRVDAVFVTNLWDFHRNDGKIRRCLLGPRRLQINGSGRILPCGNSFDAKELGDINEDSLEKILSSGEYQQEMKNRMAKDIREVPEACLSCEYRRFTPMGFQIKYMREKIFLQKPLKNFIYKTFGPAVILLEFLTRYKIFYDLFYFVQICNSRMMRKKILNSYNNNSFPGCNKDG